MQITHYPFPPPGAAPVPGTAEPYPAPLLTSDDPYDGPTSKPAADLLKLAQVHGWTGRITYANGYVPHATTGKAGAAPKFSEAVRLTRGDRHAVAVRLGGAWGSMWTWSGTRFFRRGANLEAFMSEAFGPVSACESIPMGWRALADPIQGCAVTAMTFVRGSSWGPVQGCEVPM